MISLSTIGYYFTSGLYSNTVLKEEPVNEIRLINLTNWGWILFLSIVILVVWLLIILQTKLEGAHEFGQIPEELQEQCRYLLTIFEKLYTQFQHISLFLKDVLDGDELEFKPEVAEQWLPVLSPMQNRIEAAKQGLHFQMKPR